jgi:hypothetical protein
VEQIVAKRRLQEHYCPQWTDDEAPRLTLYYLGYYRADRAQLLREHPPGNSPKVIAEIYAPEGPAAGVTILW